MHVTYDVTPCLLSCCQLPSPALPSPSTVADAAAAGAAGRCWALLGVPAGVREYHFITTYLR